MTNHGSPEDVVSLAGRLARARSRLRESGPLEPESPGKIRWALRDAEVEADSFGDDELVHGLRQLALLTELWEGLPPDAPRQASEFWGFIDEALARLSKHLTSPERDHDLQWIASESAARWGEYLALLAPSPADAQAPDAVPPSDDIGPADAAPQMAPSELFRLLTGQSYTPAPAPPRKRLTLTDEPESDTAPPPKLASQLLRLFSAPAPAQPRPADAAAPAPLPQPPVPRSEPSARADAPARKPPAAAAKARKAEAEMSAQEAFQADAEDLLERIDAIARQLPSTTQPADALRELDRCLHTLKGAAGAVGLSDLVATIHDLEEQRQQNPGRPTPDLPDQLQGLLGQVEEILRGSRSDGPQAELPTFPELTPADERPAAGPSSEREPAADDSEDGSGMVRVPRSKINELLDLVAELLILNGPRASWVGTLKGYADAARSCRNRLTSGIERLCDLDRLLIRIDDTPDCPPISEVPAPLQAIGDLADHLGEQAEDLGLLSQSARAAAERMAEDLDASTRVTRRLWDLLHEVRIVPVESLFRRLARVAQAAALSEGRRVEVVLEGEEIGLDRLVQDRVFEPLLHIVRNSLGHGIEPPAERAARGKPDVGRLTLQARRDGNTVVLEVLDDGRGLDYQAVTAKGRQLGMIGPEHDPSIDELHALLFRPGFTTRRGADALSGRGIGMDVVAREVARLHGSISLDSVAGRGTTVAIRLPARLTLEQTILFRVDGQAFALPLEAIDWTEPRQDAPSEGLRRVDARAVLGLGPAPPQIEPRVMALRIGGESVALTVDAIEGPRELVVRPLHSLMADHPVVSGTSLSADGELVLVLDAPSLSGQLAAGPVAVAGPTFHSRSNRPPPVLVVDDSISIRRLVVRHLQAMGLEAVEASDGVDAIEELRRRPVRLIITDLQMPRMDGFELLATLGRPEMSPSPPVVVSSTRSDPGTRRRIRELGALGFISKPVSLEELAEAISPFLTLTTDDVRR